MLFRKQITNIINPVKKLNQILDKESEASLRPKIQDVLVKLDQIDQLHSLVNKLMLAIAVYVDHLEKDKVKVLKENKYIFAEFHTRLNGNPDKLTVKFCADVDDSDSDYDETSQDRIDLHALHARLIEKSSAQAEQHDSGYDSSSDDEEDDNIKIGIKNGEIVLINDSKKDSKTCEKRKEIGANFIAIREKEKIILEFYDVLKELKKFSALKKIGSNKLCYLLEQLHIYSQMSVSNVKAVEQNEAFLKEKELLCNNRKELHDQLLQEVNDILNNNKNGLFPMFQRFLKLFNAKISAANGKDSQSVSQLLSQARNKGFSLLGSKGSGIAEKLEKFIRDAEELFVRAGAQGIARTVKPKSSWFSS